MLLLTTAQPDLCVPDEHELNHLESQVQSRLGMQVRFFRLLLRGNGLVLQGRAPTYYVKQLAQHAVMTLSPRPLLANEIEAMAGRRN